MPVPPPHPPSEVDTKYGTVWGSPASVVCDDLAGAHVCVMTKVVRTKESSDF